MNSVTSDPPSLVLEESDPEPQEASPGRDVPAGQDPPATAEGTPSTARLRKRTKTGCLTCRKRRIKCGEERPICSNCIRSKRSCEGYNQRIVFKDHTGGYPQGAPGLPGDLVQANLLMDPYPALPPHNPAAFPGQDLPRTIAPRPSATYSYLPSTPAWSPPLSGLGGAGPILPIEGPAPLEQNMLYGPARYAYPPQPPPPSPFGPVYGQAQAVSSFFQEPPSSAPRVPPPHPNTTIGSVTSPAWPRLDLTSSPQSYELAAAFDTTHPQDMYATPATRPGPSSDLSATGIPGQHPLPQLVEVGHRPQYLVPRQPQHPVTPPTSAPSRNFGLRTTSVPVDFYSDYRPPPRSAQPQRTTLPIPGPRPEVSSGHSMTSLAPTRAPLHQTPPSYAAASPLAYPAYDPQALITKDEVDSPDGALSDLDENSSRAYQGLDPAVALQTSPEGESVRTYTDYLDQPNMLATYRPPPLASQLVDPITARIFCHFVTATSPSFSIYERHPANPTVLFSQGSVPSSQRNLWTYILPTMALHSPPLMHAILALGALHICKLQGGSTLPSLKHYHKALRRVARLVSSPIRRGEIATLAATVLLGFWEVIAAEHAKWNSHLMGARQLLDEYDFLGMTLRIKVLSARREAERQRALFSDAARGGPPPFPAQTRRLQEKARFAEIYEVDEDIVDLFMGHVRTPDRTRPVNDETSDPRQAGSGEPDLTRQDLEDYEVRRDLCWLFRRHDVYQSILSANPLLSDYHRWSQCPPRAALGRREAIYGTSDHMLLLMGRIADFAARDQRRKRAATGVAGVDRRTSPIIDVGVRPSSAGALSLGQGRPIMYGMVPSTGRLEMPTAFRQTGHRSPPPKRDEGMEREAAMVKAEAEWTEIIGALRLFEESLGPDFQPLTAEQMPPVRTPFGDALHYRTYSIACIWSLYHLGNIVLHRAHPSMPVQAMIAAGVAAGTTAKHANEIGRIVAGLMPTGSTPSLNPNLGAALLESSLALFFAGVQYQDAAQRSWTIHSLRSTARRSGWESIAAIAAGVERAWLGASQMGMGPVYVPDVDPMARDDRVAMRSTYATSTSSEDGNDAGFTWRNPGMRVYWAIGVLGLQDDLAHLTI